MAGVIHNSVWRSWRILNRRIFFIHSQPFPSRIIGSLSWSADAVVACCRKTSPRKLRRGRSTGRTYWTSMGGASSSWGLGTRFDLINEHTFHVCRLALFFGFWGGGDWQLASSHSSKLQNSKSAKGQIKYLVYCMENAILNLGPGQSQMVWLIDYDGYKLSNVSLAVSKETAHILQDHYPERLGLAILYNPPKFFEPFWKVRASSDSCFLIV